jgi:hypothetical protein
MVINYMILYVIISLMGFRNQLLGGGTTSKMLWPNNDSCFGLVISNGWGGWTRKQPYLLRNHHPIEWAKNRSTSTASFESDAMWGLWIRNNIRQKSGFCDSDIFWLQLLGRFHGFSPPWILMNILVVTNGRSEPGVLRSASLERRERSRRVVQDFTEPIFYAEILGPRG